MCHLGEAADQLALAKTHHDNARSRTGIGVDLLNGRTDDRTEIGDHHQIVVIGHGSDPGKQAGLIRQIMAGHAKAATALHAEVLKRGALTKALFGHGNQLLGIVNDHGADHKVTLTQLHTTHTACRSAKRTHLTFAKACGAALVGRQQHVLITV